MKTVYVVRHGETESNIGGVIRGGAQTALTEKGREQARLVADRCARLSFDVIVASPFLRTKETAELIREKTGHAIEYSDLFTEWDRGASRIGMRTDDPALWAHNDALTENLKSGVRLADEENFDDLNLRAERALEYLSNRPERAILHVGHGLFSRILVGKALFGTDFSGRDAYHFVSNLITTNAGITVLELEERAGGTQWSLLTWNDFAHLG